MGSVGRLSNHVGVSRRRSPRPRPTFRRSRLWSDAAQSRTGIAGALPAQTAAPEPALDPLGGLRAPAHEPSALDWPLATVRFSDPFRWLAAGWRDFTRAPAIGLFYGACFVAMGWFLLATFQHAPAYTLALSAGFLLLGPFLCLGLYEASRSIAQGSRPSFTRSLMAWRTSTSQISIFAAVLLVLEMLWGRSAMVIFAISFDGIPQWDGTLADLLHGDNLTFVITYTIVGSIFAGLIYAVSVISMPLMLDRSVDAVTAGLTSMRLFLSQMPVMVFWGALITLIVVLAMLPGFAGLLIAGPVLGHASWHAYKQVLSLVDAPR
ncbi:MAG: DUF2189 domain-containing protein [Acidobacteriota bacterium]